MGEIYAGGDQPQMTNDDSEHARRLLPLRIGDVVVYVEQTGQGAAIEGDDIYAVAPSPQDAFQHAADFVKECVRSVGARLSELRDAADALAPQEVTAEFSVSFEAKGKTALVPVLLTGEASSMTGLKITAVWRQPDVRQVGQSG